MTDLIKGALIGAAVATIVSGNVSALTSIGGEPEHSIVRNLHCAPVSVKMPCLQPGRG